MTGDEVLTLFTIVHGASFSVELISDKMQWLGWGLASFWASLKPHPSERFDHPGFVLASREQFENGKHSCLRSQGGLCERAGDAPLILLCSCVERTLGFLENVPSDGNSSFGVALGRVS